MSNKIEMQMDDDAKMCLSNAYMFDKHRTLHFHGGDITQQVSALLFRNQHIPTAWSLFINKLGDPRTTRYRTGDQ